MGEWQEPGCRAPATTSWNGRLVCEDHYDFYRDWYQERLMEMNN